MNSSYKYLSRYRFSTFFKKVVNKVNHYYANQNIKRGSPQVAIFSFDHIGLNINNFGTYEEEILNAITSFFSDLYGITQFDTTIDIGANIGNHSLYFHKISKKIYAFEPNPKTFQLLKFNTKQHSSIKLFNHGLSNLNDVINLNEPSLNIGGSYIDSADNSFMGQAEIKIHKVAVRKLDDINELNQENISLIKIDVEGHEFEVLEGGKNIIMQNKPIIIFEHNIVTNINNIEHIEGFLQTQGYAFFKINRNFDFVSNTFYKIVGVLMRLILGESIRIKKIKRLPKKHYSSYPLIIAVPKNIS